MLTQYTLEEWLLFTLIGAIILIALVVCGLAVYVSYVLLRRLEEQTRGAIQVTAQDAGPRLSWWARFDRKFVTAAVPVEFEEAILLNHNYDGIQELDNHLPPWWKNLFYASIAFGVVYLLVFHVFGYAPLQAAEYTAEMKQAEVDIAAYKAKAADAVDETNVTLASAPAELAEGKALFDANCRACHGAEGQGGVGPNLTDEFWLHGGDLKAVFQTIKNGVPEKGMVSWKAKFKPAELRTLSSFVLSLQGTNPAGAKAPQGERYVPAGAAPAAADTAAKVL